jgi:hypothetical protein
MSAQGIAVEAGWEEIRDEIGVALGIILIPDKFPIGFFSKLFPPRREVAISWRLMSTELLGRARPEGFLCVLLQT